jgi:hypothetical protein
MGSCIQPVKEIKRIMIIEVNIILYFCLIFIILIFHHLFYIVFTIFNLIS